MKKILTILLLLASLTAAAQTLNFGIDDNSKVYWQKVFETSMDADQLLNIIVNNGKFVDVLNNDGLITCRVIDDKMDYKALGFTYMDTPLYMSNCSMSYFVTIQVKDGRYRVTVEDVKFLAVTDYSLFKRGDTSKLEDYALKKGALKNMFIHGAEAQVLNKYFKHKFTLQEKSILNNEW